jgi:murein DD-endopeptidase MepM/ murein hydrolase activator NlpD
MDQPPFNGTSVSHTTQLGLTGFTGTTIPSGINGTHLHYDVNATVIPTQSTSTNINPTGNPGLFPSGTFN